MYRSLFPNLMETWFGVSMPLLGLEPAPGGVAGDLSRFAGVYAWPDMSMEVRATDTRLVIEGERGPVEAFPIEDRVFLVDARNPDTPTVTFGAFDDGGRPHALYQMLWGLPRV
jgi:hypothetical protein